MKRTVITAILFVALIVVFAFVAIPGWKIADDYNIDFSSDDASGVFSKMTGTIVFDDKNPAQSKIDISVDAASLNSGNGLQNKELKGTGWLNVEKYPTINYITSQITKNDSGYYATGMLELHGIKKEISVPFKFKSDNDKGSFSGTFNVDRTQFNIGQHGDGPAEIIKLNFTIPVTTIR